MRNPTEFLKCEFTDAETTDLAKELAAANNTRQSLEQQKKEVDAQLKADIEAQNSTINRLSRLIVTGFEMRNVDVRIELDTPEPGKKRVVRLDTGEEVAVKSMTDQDRQMVIDLQSAAEAEEAAKEPIITPAPVLLTLPEPEVVDGATLASAAVAGTGTHQNKKRKRNSDVEGYADGSAE